jgi:phage terminase Nu1 subunit (DNA packaging protein)
MARSKAKPLEKAELKGWAEIAQYLGLPVATAQRWASSGMPVKRSGRNVVSSTEELTKWLGSQSSKKADLHLTTGESDLSTFLKESLVSARASRRGKSGK